MLYVSTTKPTHDFGWPSVMRTSRAAQYIGGSRWMVLRAVTAGLLTPAGKRGRSYTFTKESLDRFLLGEPQARREDEARTSTRTRSNSSNSNALARLRALAKGAR